MKSQFSTGNSNCVDVVKRKDGTVVVTDTQRKTGDVELLFTPEEWKTFVRGVMTGQFNHPAIPYDVADDRPMTRQERDASLMRAGRDGLTRTPENLAYVNGQHAERAGWVPYTIEMFCKKFNHDKADPKTKDLFEAFQTGRRAEAHEISMRQARGEE